MYLRCITSRAVFENRRLPCLVISPFDKGRRDACDGSRTNRQMATRLQGIPQQIGVVSPNYRRRRFCFLKFAPQRTSTLAYHVAHISKSNLRSRGFGPFQVTNVTNTTLEFDLPGGRENVSTDGITCVTGFPESLPSPQLGTPRLF